MSKKRLPKRIRKIAIDPNPNGDLKALKTITMSLEIGVPLIRDYPVYDFKAVTRLNAKF
jgi:hypothetical protein